MALIKETYPLSFMQQGMLFHHLFARDSGVDIEQIVGRLCEHLDVDALRKAWQQVIARHATLRCSFRWEGLDQPLQDMHRDVELSFEVQDWRHLSPEKQARRFEHYLVEDRQAGLSLDRPSAMRLALFQLSDHEFNLVWTVHHILLDGRAFPIVLKEVFEHYEANRKNQDLKLPAPPAYRQYIEWLHARDASGDEAFWRQKLAGFARPIPVGFSRAFSNGSSLHNHSEQEVRLTEQQTSALRSMAERHEVTLNTLVQGAWALLLSRYSGEEDVVFGATRACRKSTVPNAESIVGTFINTVPMRVHISRELSVAAWLKTLRQHQVELRGYEHTPLVNIQRWSNVPADTQLFESIIVFDHRQLNTSLRSLGPEWRNREFWLTEKTGYPITLYAYGEPELLFKISYERSRFSDDQIKHMLGHLQTLLERMAAKPNASLSSVSLLTAREQHQLLVEWNDTNLSFPSDVLIHELFEMWAKRTPNAVAVVAQGRQLTYAELNAKANQLAHYLIRHGVGPEVLVGISFDRSLDLMIGLLGIHKAGGAYVPMDPSYPKDRLAFMLEDAKPAIVLTREDIVSSLPQPRPPVILLDAEAEALTQERQENPARRSTSHNLAYVIYTSGSTGKPKGVMVEHCNVVNFFAGMDRRIGAEPPGVWLAVTSLSFDISVFELLWTLARGFKVVLYTGDDRVQNTQAPAVPAQCPYASKEVEFSLFYFASEEGARADKYKLLLEGAKFADENGFAAVWTPERHFHAFGGLYPNPSVVSAALAVMTRQIQLRTGSVVLPLHHPIRVAEEWALVDNLSQGRVGVAFAAGWQPNDFVLAPENYADRKDVMLRSIETVRRLWRGETVTMSGPKGDEVNVATLPRPVQPELPVWLTAAGNPETYRQAGETGGNLLTHLLGQSVEELAEKVQIYREAWRKHGHGPGEGHVTLMLHTFVGEDDDEVREIVRGPMKEYLKSAVDLVKKAAWHFPVNKDRDAKADKRLAELAASNDLSAEDLEALLEHAFERYYETSGLFGTPETCIQLVNRLKEIGIDEIACLVDFGVDSEQVLASLKHLNRLRERCTGGVPFTEAGASIPALAREHQVTHLQCTPSMARMLLLDPDSRQALGGLRRLMVGGEAFPPGLASELKDAVKGELHNMYGPTETTIWSCTEVVDSVEDSVPIGRPIANTTCYVLDKNLQPVPVGVPGELFIGGAGVVRGYLNRRELTSERFIADPFSPQRGARMYRTGDRVRYRADGVLEFLGRLDNQVKIRGHRVELGEIEAVLSRHLQVREVVVAARAEGVGSQLVGYVVPVKGQRPSVESLRGFLLERLPEYMVPAVYIHLEALPLTPNKKVDRAALPEPDTVRPVLEDAFVKARTPIEQQLTEIWAEVLNVKDIGVNDNFFALGGHSLSAVQVVFQARQAFGVDLPLRMIFQAPTLVELAGKVEALLIEQADADQLEELLAEIEQMPEEVSASNVQSMNATNNRVSI